jgi:hypothetical protein
MESGFTLTLTLLASLGREVYHKLSSRKFQTNWKTNCLEQPQVTNGFIPNTPVITILYIISDIRGPVLNALRIRSKIRLLSLRKLLEGHSPTFFQVLHFQARRVYEQ